MPEEPQNHDLYSLCADAAYPPGERGVLLVDALRWLVAALAGKRRAADSGASHRVGVTLHDA